MPASVMLLCYLHHRKLSCLCVLPLTVLHFTSPVSMSCASLVDSSTIATSLSPYLTPWRHALWPSLSLTRLLIAMRSMVSLLAHLYFFTHLFIPIPSSFTQRLYETLGVPHEPLTLIPPQFECPMPKLSPATFPPAMREPAPPALDQFDLDEHFAKEGAQFISSSLCYSVLPLPTSPPLYLLPILLVH